MNTRRVLVIGWDGAEPSLVLPWLEQGVLPNLAHLVSGQGGARPLRSTLRPESSIAWTTFATGADPGAHGVFGFTRFVSGGYHTRLVSSADVPLPFFWETLSQAGYQVAILNMPMAYPPRPVNGWLVCGLMTPGTAWHAFTYPPELGNRLLRQGYVVDADPPLLDDEPIETYAQRMIQQIGRRAEFAVELLTKSEWDFGMVIFTELDRLQHFFWRAEATEPGEPSAVVRQAYLALDSALGMLREVVAPHTMVAVLSDHGFGRCDRYFYVNAWLASEGLLRFKQNTSHPSLVDIALRTARRVPLLRDIKRNLIGRRGILAARARQSFIEAVDWSKTQAWYADVGGIRLNIAGREPLGIVPRAERRALAERIALGLSAVLDAGQSVVRGIHFAEDVYHGALVDRAPDLILQPTRQPDSHHNYWIASHHPEDPQRLFAPCTPYTGDHLDEGIFVVNESPDIPVRNLRDVTRWIMNQFGVESNARSEGSQLPAASTDSFLDAHEDAAVRERLRRLGYLS